jgi:hypothetical protein
VIKIDRSFLLMMGTSHSDRFLRIAPHHLPDADTTANTSGSTSVDLTIALLNRRAGHVTVRTEYAAIALKRAQQCSAGLAVVEKLTGVGGHLFSFGVATVWAGQR